MRLRFPIVKKNPLTYGNGSGKVGFRLTFQRRPNPEEAKPGVWVKAVSRVDPTKLARMKNKKSLAIILDETIHDVDLEEERPGFYIIWLKVTAPTTKNDRWAFDTCLDELGVGLI